MDWVETAVELKQSGISWTKLPAELEAIFGREFSFDQVRNRVRREPAYKNPNKVETDNLSKNLLVAISKGQTKSNLCEKYSISPRVLQAALDDIRDSGFLISDDGEKVKLCRDVVLEENKVDCNWTGEQIIRFAMCGDQQSGSKYTQHTHLHNFYDICQTEGIKKVYHAGDMFEGEKMRPGHEYEIHVHGVDDNVEFAEKTYPRREGITTEFISGNHCHSFIKQSGCDIGALLAARREDMIYLGKSNAIIQLTPNCKLELAHPLDGTAYALSYKTQKMIDAMQGGEKPNILAIGHYHKSEYLPNYRNIHAFQTGTFQAQTRWMKGKQIAAMVGGWILEVHVDDEGSITRCKGEFVPYYKMIKDDWKNWI